MISLLKLKDYFFSCFLLSSLISCASVKKVTLNDNDFTPMKEYAKVTPVVTDGFSLVLGHFEDLRNFEKKNIKDKQIGNNYTGFLDEPTPIEFSTPLTEALKKQVASGLIKRGFSISEKGEFTLNAKIENYWLEEITKGIGPHEYQCNVKIKFDLLSNEKAGTKWFSTFSSSITSGTQSQTGLDKKTSTLASCVNQILEALIHEVNFQRITRINI